jgi:hypothetical protein
LLNRYRIKSSIGGSNPPLSATQSKLFILFYLHRYKTPFFGPFLRISSTREFLQPVECSPRIGLFSDVTIEGPVSTESSNESSLADAYELLVPGWEIERF